MNQAVTSLTNLVLKATTSICSTIKENLLLYCYNFFGTCFCCHNLQQGLHHKETPLVTETINFTTES